MPHLYSRTQGHTRDSLELASLASSSQEDTAETDSRPSISSSRKASLERDDPLDSHNLAATAASSSYNRPNRHDRSFSVSSGFDLAANLFPLSSTTGSGYAPLGASTAPG
ncbi:hypothetical protein MAPG_08894, partial [Magnaporthiopsis poae ATCC 64411]